MYKYKPFKVKNRDNLEKVELLLFIANFTISNLSI